MADTKTTALLELTTVADEDLLYIVDDPAGVPTSKKVTVGKLLSGLLKTAPIVADAVVLQGAGTVASGTVTLTVTGAAFTAEDVGKTINISRYRAWEDSSVDIGVSATTLTSSDAAFTADDVGAEVMIAGAGAGGTSLVTTIASVTSATEVELAAAASTTVAGRRGRIGASHGTTIAAVTDAGSVTLTDPAGVGYTNADVAYGTDQGAAITEEIAASAALGLYNLTLPAGKILVNLPASAFLTGELTTPLFLQGVGHDSTEIVLVVDGRPADGDCGFVYVRGGNALKVRDLTVRYVGQPGEDMAPRVAYSLAVVGEDDVSPSVTLEGVRAYDTGSIASIACNGIDCSSRTILTDVEAETYGICTSHFATSGGNDHEHRLTRVRLRQKYTIDSKSTDSSYNPHIAYVHPNVQALWSDVVTVQDHRGYSLSPHVLQHFGGPTDVLQKGPSRFERVHMTGWGRGIYTAPSNPGLDGYNLAILRDCYFGFRKHSGTDADGALKLNNPVDMAGCVFEETAGGVGLTDATLTKQAASTIRACRFRAAEGFTTLKFGFVGHTWIVQDCDIYVLQSTTTTHTLSMSDAGGDYYVKISGGRAYGDPLNTSGYLLFPDDTSKRIDFEGLVVEGTWPKLIGASGVTADDQIQIHWERCHFRQTSGALTASNILNYKGIISGRDNYFASPALLPQMHASAAMSLVPPRKHSGTALTVSVNRLFLDLNHDSYPVTGGGTVNNIIVGDNSNQRLRVYGGVLHLLASGTALDLAHNAGGTGNIRTKTSATRTVAVGEMIALRHEERSGAWYEV